MRKRWTQAEIEHLESIAGDSPSPALPTAYNAWAEANGYQPRTMQAIWALARSRGIGLKAEGQYVSTTWISSLLGVPVQTITSWIDYGHLRTYEGLARSYVLRSSIRTLAKKRPHLFAGFGREKLFLLLEDEKLANHLAENYPRNNHRHRGVRAIEAGKVYRSLRLAAKAHSVSHTAIARAIHAKRDFAGFHWEYVA
jgi:hypothetical protein